MVLGGMLGLLLIAGALFVRDVQLVRAALEDTRASLQEVRSALGEVDVASAEAALDAADDHLGVARSRSGGPLWNLVAALPVVGENVEVVRAVVAVGSGGLDLAQAAVQDGQDFLAGGLDIRVVDGQLDLQPVLEARDLVAGLPLEDVIAARERLAAVDPSWQPRQIRDGKAESLDFADDAIETVERAGDLLDAMPGFLGMDEPRRYFLGVQTPAELRGTGGLIGYWTVLEIDEGEFDLSDSGVYEALDDLGVADDQQAAQELDPTGAVTGSIHDLRGDPWDGVPADPAFEERYAHTAATGFFTNVNVDPDLPTTARVALDLFERRTGDELDGMVLVDPVAMQRILEAVGEPLPLTQELEHPDLPSALPPSQVAEFALIDVYEIYGQGSDAERRFLLRSLGDAAFARVFDGAWDGVAMSRAITDVAATRNLQVYSEHEPEQAAFSRVGVAGELKLPDRGDFLAVTANNAVGGKQDVHLGHEFDVDITLSRPRREEGHVVVDRDMRVRVTVDNPLTPDGMDLYIVGNCPVGGDAPRCFDGPAGWNRTWFSVWTPGDDTLQAATTANGVAPVRADRFRGFRVIDHYLETPPTARAWFELEFRSTIPVEFEDDQIRYELAWFRQSKATADLITLTVAAPEGWETDTIRVEGAGTGEGMGANAVEPALAVDLETRGGQLRGTANADASFTAVLVREPE